MGYRNNDAGPRSKYLIRDCLVIDGAGWSPDIEAEVAIEITNEFAIGPEPWHGPTIIIGPEVVTELVI